MVKKNRSFDESVSGRHIQGGFSSSLRSVLPNLTLVWRTVRPSGPQSTPSSSQGHTKAQLGRCQTSRRITVPPHARPGTQPRSAPLWNSLCFSVLPGSRIFYKLKVMPNSRPIWEDSNANILKGFLNSENYKTQRLFRKTC